MVYARTTRPLNLAPVAGSGFAKNPGKQKRYFLEFSENCRKSPFKYLISRLHKDCTYIFPAAGLYEMGEFFLKYVATFCRGRERHILS